MPVRRAVVCGLALAAGCCLAVRAPAQSVPQFPYLAALNADDLVRSGADSRYYPFGRLKTGDVVKVIGEKAGWARVVVLGPGFREFFGFIKYPKTDASPLRLSPDGSWGTTLRAVDLLAPNLDADNDPRSSWKPAATLPADRTVRILETAAYEGEAVHRVSMPPDAEGWVELRNLREATPAEGAAFEAAAPGAVAAKPKAPPPDVVPVSQEPLGRVKPNEGAAIPDAAATQPPKTQADTAVAAKPPPKPKRSAKWRLAQVALEDLEAAYARLLTEPIETAEVDPLRGLYLDLAKRHPDSRPIAQYADTRARQLELWAEVQKQKLELSQLRQRAKRTTGEAEVARQALEATDRYVAAGRLEASIIYDGERLPKLLRLRDPATGRTLGYLEPDETFDFAAMLGKRVGIVGTRAYDGGLRLTVIAPKRIDVVEPER